MKANMGTVDKVIRLILAAIILVVNLTGQVTGTAAIILWVVAAVLVFTSVMSFCPAYLPLGISTRKKDQ